MKPMLEIMMPICAARIRSRKNSHATNAESAVNRNDSTKQAAPAASLSGSKLVASDCRITAGVAT